MLVFYILHSIELNNMHQRKKNKKNQKTNLVIVLKFAYSAGPRADGLFSRLGLIGPNLWVMLLSF